MVKKTNKDTSAEATQVEEPVIAEAVEPEAEISETAEVAPVEEAPVVEPNSPEVAVEVPPTKVTEVSHNPTFIEWPTDLWGLTHDLKAAFVAAASRVQGALDKKRLVDEVINIGRLHLEAKFTVDAKVRQAAIDAVIAENEAKEAEEAEQEPAQKELF